MGSLSQVGAFGVGWDIDRNAASPDGRLAVDYQWGADDNRDHVAIFDVAGNRLASGTAPSDAWNLKALAFDAAGALHVVGDHDDGSGQRVMHVSGYAADGSYLGSWQPENVAWHGPIAVAVPEPGTGMMFLAGLTWVGLYLARGRKTPVV
ncbi:MAG: PEP-CTERM sorting domain-containing protein [Rhodocyclaceae bacterium]|nr:PEP-CTERM sorting domain-containing protein [Rhodocyclaceae bacterium]